MIPFLIGGAIALVTRKSKNKEVGLTGSWHARNNKFRHTTNEKQQLKPGYKYLKGGDIINTKTGKIYKDNINNIIVNEPEVIKAEPKKKKPTTILQKVEAAKTQLVKMKTHTELRKWAIENGMDNKNAFPRFKKALNKIGLDYNDIKQRVFNNERKKLTNTVSNEIVLYTDYKSSYNQFAITDENENPLWYGRDFDYPDCQAAGELNAAKKAIWLASKIASINNDEAIKLLLYVDAQWLTYNNKPKHKAFVLNSLARRYNVDLYIEWIPGVDNPADFYTTEKGYMKWQDSTNKELTSLLKPIKNGLALPFIEALGKVSISEEISTRVLKTMPQEIINYIYKNFKNIYGSPYSTSFYSQAGQTWDFSPPNQIRVSDHWNFWSRNYNDPNSQLKQHSITDKEVYDNSHWTIAKKNDEGVYEVIMSLPKKQELPKRYDKKQNYDLMASKQPNEIIYKQKRKKEQKERLEKQKKREERIKKSNQWVSFDRTYKERIGTGKYSKYNTVEETGILAILVKETDHFITVKYSKKSSYEYKYKKSTLSNYKEYSRKPREKKAK